jgi:hypothetical protein
MLTELPFALRHFRAPVFPRTISTFKSHGRQFEVFNEEEMLRAYLDSDFVDSRVNGFPSYTEYKGIQRYPPDFIFADLDLALYPSQKCLERSLFSTLRNFKKIDGQPTVLWTGNGYHIYQPLNGIILEELNQFHKFERPSLKFIRFVERVLTSGKSDQSHSPSFKSCMIRIPGSFNSKCPFSKNKVRVIQRWDGYRPSIGLLLGTFHAYLVCEKVKETKIRKKMKRGDSIEYTQGNNLTWIEILLKTPIEDYRKNAIGLILCPYLLNIKNMSYNDAFLVIRNWLDRCSKLHQLDSNFDYKIKYSLNTAVSKHQLPIKFSTLKMKNKELHDKLKMKM